MKRLGLVGLLLVAAAVTANPSSAKVIDQGHYSDEPFTFGYNCGDFLVEVEGTTSGVGALRVGKGKTATAFFGRDNYSFTEVHTNADTGESITVVGNGNFVEIKATRMPEEGPNVFKFTAIDAIHTWIYDSDGNLIARERGSIMSSILFDTQGDNVPGGVFLEFLEERINGQVVDYCELLA